MKKERKNTKEEVLETSDIEDNNEKHEEIQDENSDETSVEDT